jgi:hypothetical protein
VDAVDVDAVESELVAVLVESLVLGVVDGGLPFEVCDDPGMIIVGQATAGSRDSLALNGVSEFAKSNVRTR